jgi:hypothetical protein
LGHAIIAALQRGADLSRSNYDRSVNLARQLSSKLRAAEDRISELQAQIEYFKDRAVHGEKWLQRVQQKMEHKFRERRP